MPSAELFTRGLRSRSGKEEGACAANPTGSHSVLGWGRLGRQAVQWAPMAVLVSCRTDQLGMFTNKELEQLGPVLDGFSLMTYDYPSPQQ